MEPKPKLSVVSHEKESLIRRSFDASEINVILNHPEVFPFITAPGIEQFNVEPLLRDPRNVLLMSDGGGIFFIQLEPGIYEVHTNFLPKFRGLHALRASREAYRYMFTHTDAMELKTKVPGFNKAADKFCQWVGASFEFERKNIWPTKDGLVEMKFYALRYDDWVRKADGLVEGGKRFHAHLESELKRFGQAHRDHPDEECHDRRVGICAEMIYAGQPEKAVVLYNRWAAFAGYGLLVLMSRDPIIIDIGDAVLQVQNGSFRVLPLRDQKVH